MSSNYGQFLRDVQTGFEEGEKPVQEFLKDQFGILTKNVGKEYRGWDLEIGELDPDLVKKLGGKSRAKSVRNGFIKKFGKTFEIKRDKTSDRTGNFFYEVWSNSRIKSQGCMAGSKADVLVIVRKSEFLFIKRGFFLSWIVDNLYHNTNLARGWKKNTSGKGKTEMKNSSVSPAVRGILIPIEDIKKHVCIEVFERK